MPDNTIFAQAAKAADVKGAAAVDAAAGATEAVDAAGANDAAEATDAAEAVDALDQGELAALATSRANVYRVLARCYAREIDEAFAHDVTRAFSLESEDEALARELSAMCGALDGADAAALEQLAVTFDRVFFGMGPLGAKHAFPYESVYTSARGLMMQDAYAEVVQELRANGFAKDEAFTEPEDHLAVELSFMAELATRSLDAIESGSDEDVVADITAQLEFLRAHLLSWTARFCADLEAACEGFYAHLARFTRRFLELDERILAELSAL